MSARPLIPRAAVTAFAGAVPGPPGGRSAWLPGGRPAAEPPLWRILPGRRGVDSTGTPAVEETFTGPSANRGKRDPGCRWCLLALELATATGDDNATFRSRASGLFTTISEVNDMGIPMHRNRSERPNS